MILEAVVIILREVLEAALLISLLLAVARTLKLGIGWLAPAAVMGFTGATLYAVNIGWISEQFDYSGQELLNALMQGLIWFSVSLLFALSGKSSTQPRLIIMTMATAVVLALTRECSEIFLYIQAYGQGAGHWGPVLAGSVLGGITGLSVGVLLYFVIVWTGRPRTILRTTHVLLAVVVAGIVTQAVSLLEQVDRIPSAQPLWDSSSWLPENSVLGQLLYALLGYEATPSPWHVGVYLLVIVSLAASYRLGGSRQT